jgi:clan AA aspartic protease
MGLIHANIELLNGSDFMKSREGLLSDGEIRRLNVRMNVDSGAIMMAINEKIKEQLGLPVLETRPAQLADGSIVQLAVVGPVEVRFANRQCTTRALVLPGEAEPLLGAIPMEDMDVIIDPRLQQLIVHPDHPLRAQMALR